VGTKHHLIRRDVPLFDNNGNLVDLEERRLEPMDVVAVQARVCFRLLCFVRCVGIVPDRIAFSGADHLNRGNSMVLIVLVRTSVRCSLTAM
jgi:hypothetical protein